MNYYIRGFFLNSLTHYVRVCIATLLIVALNFELSGCSHSPKNKELKNLPSISSPQADINTSASNALEQKQEIAIMLPLSGEDGSLGVEMARLIEKGIADSGYSIKPNISLYDMSHKTEVKYYVDNIKDKNTALILGPVSKDMVSLVHAYSSGNIPILTLSNDISLVSKMNGVYIFGHMPIRQTERILSYMIDQDITKDIILLIPARGNLSKVLKELIANAGGREILTVEYTDVENMAAAVSKVTNFVHGFNEKFSNSHKPGIYVADNKANMEHLLSLIRTHKLDKVAYIFGDNRLETSASHDLNILFTGHGGGNTILDEPEYTHMHKLAYDLGLLAGSILAKPDPHGGYLSNPQWIEGSSGFFKIQDRITERKYGVLKRVNGKTISVWGIE